MTFSCQNRSLQMHISKVKEFQQHWASQKKCTTLRKRCLTFRVDILTKYVQFDRGNLNLDFGTQVLKIKQKLTITRARRQKYIQPRNQRIFSFLAIALVNKHVLTLHETYDHWSVAVITVTVHLFPLMIFFRICCSLYWFQSVNPIFC